MAINLDDQVRSVERLPDSGSRLKDTIIYGLGLPPLIVGLAYGGAYLAQYVARNSDVPDAAYGGAGVGLVIAGALISWYNDHRDY